MASGISSLIPAPPKETAFTDAAGRITTPWVLWLSSITSAGAVVSQLVTNIAGALLAANNLADLANVVTARTNLGLGSAATQNSSAFDASGSAAAALASALMACLEIANNLSDLSNAAAARTNLGLGSAATQNTSAFDAAGAAAAAQAASLPASTVLAQTLTAVTHKFVSAYNSATGLFSLLQPAASDISGLAASATTDTTNAANISSGTLPAARLPNPSASTLGGVESLAAVASKWINTISTSGVPSATQPAFSDISGTLGIAGGGTGQTTASGALSALGGASLGGGNQIFTNASAANGALSSAFTIAAGADATLGALDFIVRAFPVANPGAGRYVALACIDNNTGGVRPLVLGTFNGTSFGRILIATTTDNGTDNLQVNGSILSTGLHITAGSNKKTGSGTLAAGTATIANTSVTANSKVFVQDTTSGALTNVGTLVVTSKTAGTGFTVQSGNPLDTSTFDYWILETA